MSTYVIGFMPHTADYLRKARAYQACEEAGLCPPKELLDLFENGPPDEAGMLVEIKAATKQWNGDCASGIEVDITKLPPGVTIIRFKNSY
jgi:hypothetical protein